MDERTTTPARRRDRAAHSLPSDPSDEELARDWTLSAADIVEIQGCRGDDKRLRFALQLCALRLYGCFLATYDAVPLRIVNHLARQLALPPVLLLDPAPRPATESEHQQRLRHYLGYQLFGPDTQTTLEQQLTRRAQEGASGEQLVADAQDLLRTWQVIPPARSTVERLVASIATRAQDALFEAVTAQLSLELCQTIDHLLTVPDGALWYTGQFANVLGRLDPHTGEIKEYRLKTPNAGPHGLAADTDGNIWYTGNFKAHIGKLNPHTGDVTEYPMPDPAARDPHTPTFDHQGTLWFTVQGGNMVGRLIPQTGELTLVTSPTPQSRPYGMVVNAKGLPFFVEFGANKIASIDPHTMAIREYVLPHAESRPRRIAITSDDVLWYSEYARGYLERFDPATGQAREWPSPGGPQSQPYGMVAVRDVLWYSEAGVKPNTVVRFDPKTETFQTWTIPSGGGVVRNMDATRDGNLVLAYSGVNRMALVHVH
jgi:virginiamycin B lyase